MAAAEQPFDDREHRYFLAEILKVSSISPHDLLNLIYERGINPSWEDIALPNGRSVTACKRALDVLKNPQIGLMGSFQPEPPSGLPPSAQKSKRKRPLSVEQAPIVSDRTIQPQHSFLPVNVPVEQISYQAPPTAFEGEPLKKKRGRPNKEIAAARAREAEALGIPYPRPRKPKTPRPSLAETEGLANAGTDQASASKQDARKPGTQFATSTVAPHVSDQSSPIEATTNIVDRVAEDLEPSTRNTIPETQASDFAARDSLVAEMQEHAARVEADTVQSSTTLIGDSVPRRELEPRTATSNPATTSG